MTTHNTTTDFTRLTDALAAMPKRDRRDFVTFMELFVHMERNEGESCVEHALRCARHTGNARLIAAAETMVRRATA